MPSRSPSPGPTTPEAEPCTVCDRAGCRRRELSIAYYRLTADNGKPKRGKEAEWQAALDALSPVADDCARHKVDWRAEALRHRAERATPPPSLAALTERARARWHKVDEHLHQRDIYTADGACLFAVVEEPSQAQIDRRARYVERKKAKGERLPTESILWTVWDAPPMRARASLSWGSGAGPIVRHEWAVIAVGGVREAYSCPNSGSLERAVLASGSADSLAEAQEQADAVVAALSAPPDLTALRPEVAAFAQAMEARLRVNDHKPGWKGDDPHRLMERLREETEELHEDLIRHDIIAADSATSPAHLAAHRADIAGEAADVANFAMMIADVCGGLVNAAPGLRGAAVTVGQALADPRVQSGAYVFEYAGDCWEQVKTLHRGDRGLFFRFCDMNDGAKWTPWQSTSGPAQVTMYALPARLVPLADADLDPTTRGPMPEGGR